MGKITTTMGSPDPDDPIEGPADLVDELARTQINDSLLKGKLITQVAGFQGAISGAPGQLVNHVHASLRHPVTQNQGVWSGIAATEIQRYEDIMNSNRQELDMLMRVLAFLVDKNGGVVTVPKAALEDLEFKFDMKLDELGNMQIFTFPVDKGGETLDEDTEEEVDPDVW